MTTWRAAVVALLVSVQVVACGGGAASDCGVAGIAPHPEIGGEILYNCWPASGGTALYLLDVATGHVRTVIDDHAWNTDPAWSPDGKRIAYVSTRDGETDLYVLDLSGARITRLTTGGGWNGNPTWSPDAAWIMFDSARDGVSPSPHNNFRNLFVVRPDGTDLRRVTGLPRYNGDPSWRPDGQRIAFISDRDDTFNIFTMAPDGADQRQLTRWQGLDAGVSYARWSPDGTRVVFSATDPKGDGPARSLYVVSTAGGEPHRVSAGVDTQPDWSPDGQWIAFTRVAPKAGEVFVMRPDGTGITQLTADGAWKVWVRWRP